MKRTSVKALKPGIDCNQYIDVGINFSNEKQKLVEGIDISNFEDTNIKISPVPGGAGGITTSVLIRHIAKACERS